MFVKELSVLQLCLSIHFFFKQGLKVNQRQEFGVLSAIFLSRTQSYMHNSTFTQTCRFPEICQSFQKFPIDILFPRLPFWVLERVYFKTSIAASGSCNSKQLPLMIFNKCTRDREIFFWQNLHQVKSHEDTVRQMALYHGAARQVKQ